MATLINPVDHRLYDVLREGADVHIAAPMLNEVYQDPEVFIPLYGDGYYDTSEEFESYPNTYYRSNTPAGVRKKKSGQGLMLYSGLSLSVVHGEGQDGVFSQIAQRSSEASTWWEKQVRTGFAEEDYETETGQEPVELSIDEDWIDRCDLDPESCEAEVIAFDPSYVTVYVDFEKQKVVQVLPAENVKDRGLVLAWDTEDSHMEILMSDAPKIPTSVLLDIDMSTTADPRLLINILQLLESDPDVSRADLEDYTKRYPGPIRGADSARLLEMVGQQAFPFEEVEEAATEEGLSPNPRVRSDRAWKDFFGKLAEPVE